MSQVILITGCSSGFGLLTALRFARAGDRVVATMRTPEKAPAALTDPIAKEKLPIRLGRLDVCDPASVTAAVRDAGEIDVLVNNACIELRSSIEDASDADVQRQFDTNVYGSLRMMRAVLPQMRARKRGTIVNLSSIAGIVARPFGGLYSATKHAIEAISEALHFEAAPLGIRVVLIQPGSYATRLIENAIDGQLAVGTVEHLRVVENVVAPFDASQGLQPVDDGLEPLRPLGHEIRQQPYHQRLARALALGAGRR